MPVQLDVLVIGQGLAGSCLAYALLHAGKSVAIIDDGAPTTASAVGAGIMNPLVFRYITQSWRATTYLPKAKAFYQSIESQFGHKLLHKLPIARLLSENEYRLWERRAAEDKIQAWTDAQLRFPFDGSQIDYPFGAVLIDAARADMALFTELMRTFFASKGIVVRAKFDHCRLITDKNGFVFDGISAKNLVFCEGQHAVMNPLFGFVPFRPVKGELLTLRIPRLPETHIINRGVFVLPLGNHLFRVGSNYDWDDLRPLPTEKTRNSLLEKLKVFLKLPYEVVDHQAGIRPSVADRRPVVGRHPVYDNIYILNGLGTKGAMLAPAMSEQLINLMVMGVEVDAEVNVGRFWD